MYYYILHITSCKRYANTDSDYLDRSLQLLLYRESVLDGTEDEYSIMNQAIEVVHFYLDAIRGDHILQAVIGSFFYEGKRVKQDYKEAFCWCLKAAEYGIGMDESQYLIGRMYELGQGVKRNHAMAIEWYLKAAAQENILAMARLTTLFGKSK